VSRNRWPASISAENQPPGAMTVGSIAWLMEVHSTLAAAVPSPTDDVGQSRRLRGQPARSFRGVALTHIAWLGRLDQMFYHRQSA
jgi:hypothetical protein